MARLDRLGPAKEVAQIGAAIGREFSHALLAAVVRKPRAGTAIGTRPLIAAGLLFRQGVPPHASYLFKHALVQDAAYGTLLREPRRALHARIAETLESHSPTLPRTSPNSGAPLHRGWPDRESGRLFGERRDSGRWRARRWLKPQGSSHAPSTRSPPCPRRPRCVASRSSFKSRL